MPDDPYHYPPELLDLLIDAIPLLCRSKLDVLTFFRGCGLPVAMTADLRARVQQDRASINKYEITRVALTRINEGGDGTLRYRREVLKRVTGFDDFSSCWPEDQLKARGLVASVRELDDQFQGVLPGVSRSADEEGCPGSALLHCSGSSPRQLRP